MSGPGFLDECRLSLGAPIWLVRMNLGCAVVSQFGLLDESRININIPETLKNGTPNYLDSAGGLLDQSLGYWCPDLACWMKTG